MKNKNVKLGIIDYKINNITSIKNVLKKLKYHFQIVNYRSNLSDFDAFILPGVGSFPYGIRNLNKNNMIKRIKFQVLHKKKPILGICLGMQLFSTISEENQVTKGLNLIRGNVEFIKPNSKLKTPIVGWYKVKKYKNCNLLKDIKDNSYFYFDHSLRYNLKNKKNIIASTFHNKVEVISIIKKNNIYGVQFHPEKSSEQGLKLISNFLNNI